jgi:hypothetical protein
MNEPTYSDYFINLSPYINDSGVCVPQHFSLHRAYILFRTLGLRHMTVVSHTNQVPFHSILDRITTCFFTKNANSLTKIGDDRQNSDHNMGPGFVCMSIWHTLSWW